NVGFITAGGGQPFFILGGSNQLHFVSYDTLGQGCIAFMRWLQTRGALTAADSNDLGGYIAALQAGGYLGTGGDYATYQTAIAGIMHQYVGITPTPYSEGGGGIVSITTMTTTQAVGIGLGVVLVAAVTAYALSPKTKRAGWPRPSRVAMENPRRSSGRSSNVQSLLFSRKYGWTPSKAKAWAKSHGYKTGSPDITDNQIHLTQAPASRFKRVATKPFGRGIQARIGFYS